MIIIHNAAFDCQSGVKVTFGIIIYTYHYSPIVWSNAASFTRYVVNCLFACLLIAFSQVSMQVLLELTACSSVSS